MGSNRIFYSVQQKQQNRIQPSTRKFPRQNEEEPIQMPIFSTALIPEIVGLCGNVRGNGSGNVLLIAFYIAFSIWTNLIFN